jgi:hypothetical protein
MPTDGYSGTHRIRAIDPPKPPSRLFLLAHPSNHPHPFLSYKCHFSRGRRDPRPARRDDENRSAFFFKKNPVLLLSSGPVSYVLKKSATKFFSCNHWQASHAENKTQYARYELLGKDGPTVRIVHLKIAVRTSMMSCLLYTVPARGALLHSVPHRHTGRASSPPLVAPLLSPPSLFLLRAQSRGGHSNSTPYTTPKAPHPHCPSSQEPETKNPRIQQRLHWSAATPTVPPPNNPRQRILESNEGGDRSWGEEEEAEVVGRGKTSV